jgi:thiopeptide-type bacteriocin biosynthesis protein
MAPPGVPLVSAGFFVLRAPLLAFDELEAWSADLALPGASDAQVSTAAASDKATLRRRLSEACERPEVLEALWVASPSLVDSLDVWRFDPDSRRGRRVERALVGYFLRMAGRATPFGLMAGCGIGATGSATRLTLAPRAASRRRSRLDGADIAALCRSLSRDPAIRPHLLFRPNTSLYRAAGRLRFAEARDDAGKETWQLSSVEPSSFIEATLERAAGGARLADLAHAIVEDDPELTAEEARVFVDELVTGQLLVPDLEPPLTGNDPLESMSRILSACPEAGKTREALDRLGAELSALDASGVGAPLALYRKLGEEVAALPLPSGAERRLQVDVTRPADGAVLGPLVLDEIVRGVALLRRITRRADPLASFREAFERRYGQREVPLLEALDEDAGVGLSGEQRESSPLLVGLGLGEPAGDALTPWGVRESFLLGKLAEALRSGRGVIELTDDDLATMSTAAVGEPPPPPSTFAVHALVSASSGEAVDRGDFQVTFLSASGPGGGDLLGRFCHLDEVLAGRVRTLLAAEEAENPDAIFAEIVHLPQPRIRNVVSRPALRRREMPYLATASVPPDDQVAASDLLVTVRDGRIRLRSAREARRVIPRLACAHNWSHPSNLPVYRFLCALQSQGVAGPLAWDWGPLANAPFLPRVTHGRLVLSAARWTLTKEACRPLADARGEGHIPAVRALRRDLGLPRWLGLVGDDASVPIDLENVLCQDLLCHAARRPPIRFVELAGPEQLCAHGPEGRYVHELVVPLVRETGSAQPPAARFPRNLEPALPESRRFPPGSAWLYGKLYTGAASADGVLTALAPVVERARAEGHAEGWFFSRYGDPGWHVRVRFRGGPDRLLGTLLPAFREAVAPLLAEDAVHRMQLDTYERETERYGGPVGVSLAEELFEADSDAVLSILSEGGDADERWRLVLIGMDRLLADIGFDLETRLAVVAGARRSFAGEHGNRAESAHRIGELFRKERGRLERLLLDDDPEGSGAVEALRLRSGRLASVVRRLREAEAAGGLTVPLPDLAASFLHMHANRMLRGAARAQERVIYDFLERLYQGQRARPPHGRERA